MIFVMMERSCQRLAFDGGQLDPAFISVLYHRDGESSYALRVEGRDPVVFGSVRPISHEKPKFNAFQESMPIFKKNATQYLRRIKEGSRFRFDGLGEYNHPAMFHGLFDQVGHQRTIHEPNQGIRQLLLVRFDEVVFKL